MRKPGAFCKLWDLEENYSPPICKLNKKVFAVTELTQSIAKLCKLQLSSYAGQNSKNKGCLVSSSATQL